MAASRGSNDDADTPTTPRATKFPQNVTADPVPSTSQRPASNQGTPTPSQPLPQDIEDVIRPGTSGSGATSDAMDLDDADGEQHDSDMEDDDDADGEGDAASRKKKGQRFFCTGYPPCNLSFTRSEHLARHIRKHTGERPFQCHCNRRFSRLDNLRQHAQTVHVNEEIPTDSLAATGTRFQRQIRTDRVRQGPRPRSGTMGSTGSHSRGHSRNLSASSIGSTSSNYSTITESKRRPPPLLMASDSSRPKLGLDPPSTPPSHYQTMGPPSPGGLTPTSATWSAAPGSPGYASFNGSPMSNASRMTGSYSSRTPGRRLSVPSGPNPYQPQYANSYPYPTYGTPMGPPSSNNSTQASVYASPTSSTFNFAPSYQGPPGEDWRRRTWHPSTYTGANYNYGRPATSGLTYSQTPDAPQPAYAQHATAAAGQAPRLPGIESFDHMQHRPSTPPRRQHSPSHPESSPSQSMKPSSYPELDEHGQVARPTAWGQQALEEIHRVGGQPNPTTRSLGMGPPPPIMASPNHQQQIAQEALQMHSSNKRTRRQAWYNGPPGAARVSPEDSSSSDGVPTPGTSAVDVQPMIMPSSGYMDHSHPMITTEAQQNV